MNCPLCFAEAAPGFNLTLEEVNEILDHLVATEGNPQVVQFSGGEPSIHPQIIPMMQAAQQRGIPNVMLNTNGKRIARDDKFLAELARIKPNIYSTSAAAVSCNAVRRSASFIQTAFAGQFQLPRSDPS